MKISQFPQKIIIFLKEVRLEMKKVNWPTRRETTRYTLIVVGISFGAAIFLGLADFILGLIRDKFILR